MDSHNNGYYYSSDGMNILELFYISLSSSKLKNLEYLWILWTIFPQEVITLISLYFHIPYTEYKKYSVSNNRYER